MSESTIKARQQTVETGETPWLLTWDKRPDRDETHGTSHESAAGSSVTDVFIQRSGHCTVFHVPCGERPTR